MSMAFSIYTGPVLLAADADRVGAGNGISTPITTMICNARVVTVTSLQISSIEMARWITRIINAREVSMIEAETYRVGSSYKSLC